MGTEKRGGEKVDVKSLTPPAFQKKKEKKLKLKFRGKMNAAYEGKESRAKKGKGVRFPTVALTPGARKIKGKKKKQFERAGGSHGPANEAGEKTKYSIKRGETREKGWGSPPKEKGPCSLEYPGGGKSQEMRPSPKNTGGVKGPSLCWGKEKKTEIQTERKEPQKKTTQLPPMGGPPQKNGNTPGKRIS